MTEPVQYLETFSWKELTVEHQRGSGDTASLDSFSRRGQRWVGTWREGSKEL